MKLDVRQSFLNSLNTELIRTITFALKRENLIRKKEKFKHDICCKFDSVNNSIEQRLEKISKLSRTVPFKVSVSLSTPAWPLYEKNINEIYGSLINVQNLRVLINFENIHGKEINKIINQVSDVSHLIEVRFEFNKNDLNTIQGPSSTVYVSSLDEVMRVIEDIMLDISMYYTFIKRDDSIDIKFRRDFSLAKISHIENKKLVSKTWDNDKHRGYVAFASYFWGNDSFDFSGYVKFWEDLSKYYESDGEYEASFDLFTQLRRHKSYKELPIKKIARLFEKLRPGEYVLARIIKIPRRKKFQRTLLAIFGGAKLHRGKIVVLTMDKIKQLDNFLVNVNIFKFIK